MLDLVCEWHWRQAVTGKLTRILTTEQTMHEDIIPEPVVLIDDHLDIVAGGRGLNLDINVDVNVATIQQIITQIQLFGSNNVAEAANVANISQSA
jgi:hypothetical protein